MTQPKARLTVTVDRDLLDAANDAVASGRAASLSAWVNRAIAERLQRERKLAALAEAVAAYEAEHGVISDREIADQLRADRASAVVIRGSGRTTPRKARRR